MFLVVRYVIAGEIERQQTRLHVPTVELNGYPVFLLRWRHASLHNHLAIRDDIEDFVNSHKLARVSGHGCGCLGLQKLIKPPEPQLQEFRVWRLR